MSAMDVALVLAIFLLASVEVVMSWVVLVQFQSAIVSTPELNFASEVTAYNQALNNLKIFDTMGLFVVIGMGLSVIATTFLARTHPIFAIPAIILMIIHIVVSSLYANIYIYFVNAHPWLQSAADNFPLILWIFQHFPQITLLISVFLIATAYGKIPTAPIAGSGGGGEI